MIPNGPLRYLIGADADHMPSGHIGEIIEVPYDANTVPPVGAAVGYINLFDENNTGHYGPYLHTSDTADEYHEGQIDPKGPGWHKNLSEQFKRRKESGFEYVELDNPDAYHWDAVKDALDLALIFKLKVIAKNVLICERAFDYLLHPNVFGAIVEKDCGTCDSMEKLRRRVQKYDLPVWFVSFGSGKPWAMQRKQAMLERGYRSMSVTYSSAGEYGNSVDIQRPL